MKYIFLFIAMCFFWFSSMLLVIRHYEAVRIDNKAFVAKNEALEKKIIEANREINGLWKERNFWIKEANRRKK